MMGYLVLDNHSGFREFHSIYLRIHVVSETIQYISKVGILSTFFCLKTVGRINFNSKMLKFKLLGGHGALEGKVWAQTQAQFPVMLNQCGQEHYISKIISTWL